MQDSNITYVPNTYKYGDLYRGNPVNLFDDTKGDVEFFRKITDYDALRTLRLSDKMGRSMNASYYIFTGDQRRELDPNFEGVMISPRELDPLIKAENERNDAEYGYSIENDFFPLVGEIVVDKNEYEYVNELQEQVDNASDASDAESRSLGLYIRQLTDDDVSAHTTDADDTEYDETEYDDPFYYLQREHSADEAGDIRGVNKAKQYEEKNGTIFNAFVSVSQERIIQSPANQYTFVNAGPGTGKTYTLIKKIAYMIDVLETEPNEILVLCFTNAAVNEIKSRIKKSIQEGISLVNIEIRTFHSFSWMLIGQANEAFRDREDYKYIDFAKLNYDKSLREAEKIIRRYGDEVLGGIRHLIIDEIQDLTNERASLVLTMVRECMKHAVGVTVLGDSCQAIYGFTNNERFFNITSDQFYMELFSEFYERGELYKLVRNVRQSKKLVGITEVLRKHLQDKNKNNIKAYAGIIGEMGKEPSYTKGTLTAKAPNSYYEKWQKEGTVCLLCRTNAQVLAASANLRKKGIDHVINAYDEFEYLSGWVGKVFGPLTKELITYDEFCRMLSKVDKSIDAGEVWQKLQAKIGSKNNVLLVAEILKAVAESRVDDPHFRNIPKGSLFVSNIHKAKGREYDVVLLEKKCVDNIARGEKKSKKEDYLEEARVLYVALTRPKKTFRICELSQPKVRKAKELAWKRWVKRHKGLVQSIEVRTSLQASDAVLDSFNTTDIQNYIRKHVSVGDEINLVLNKKGKTDIYDIIHVSSLGERKVIGRVNDDFMDDLRAVMDDRNTLWPSRIRELYVSGVHSMISDDYKKTWCWVNFCGLGLVDNDIY